MAPGELAPGCPVPEALPAGCVVVVEAGGPAATEGVTADELADAGPKPRPLPAWTLNVYCVPLASPRTTVLVAGAATVAVWPPGLVTTRYCVT